MKRLYIGLCGKPSAGKDTFAELLRKQLNESRYTPAMPIVYSLAQPIKRMAEALTGRPLELWEGKTDESRRWREEFDPMLKHLSNSFAHTPRQFLQWLGTDCFRAQDENFWLNVMQVCLESLNEATTRLVIVPEVRFKNEVDFIKASGGLIIRITRDNAEAITGAAARHISEAAKISEDYLVSNDTTINELNNSAMRYAEKIIEYYNETLPKL